MFETTTQSTISTQQIATFQGSSFLHLLNITKDLYDYTLNADMLLAPFLHGDRTALCVRSVSTEQFLPTKSTKDGL